jgi:hypothetical protein
MKPEKPLVLDFSVIDPPIKKLHTNISYDLEKLPLAKRPKGTEIVRIHLGVAYAGYQSTKYLCAESPADPLRVPEFLTVAPSIQRSMLDAIFNLIYFSTDFEERISEYFKATWREAHERHLRYDAAYGKFPEWTEYLDNTKKYASMIEGEEKITQEQVENPKLVPYWPIPSQMIKKLDAGEIKEYFEYLDAWFYKSYSQQDHLSGLGLARKGPMYLLGPAHAENLKSLPILRSQIIARGFLLMLMTLSEINVLFKLNKNKDLQYLWTVLSGYFGESKEIYEMRYQGLLAQS